MSDTRPASGDLPRDDADASPPAPPGGWTAPDKTTSSHGSRLYLIGFAPLVLLVFLAVAAPSFLAPLFDTSVTTTANLPLGWLLLGIAVLFMAGGILVMRAFPSALGVALGMLVFTFPSLVIILFGPAMVLIAENLAA